MTDRENRLIDMRIVTNAHLDKYNDPTAKREIIDNVKDAVFKAIKAPIVELLGKPLKTEEDLVKMVQIVGRQYNYTEEEGALYLGTALLAWDEIKLEEQQVRERGIIITKAENSRYTSFEKHGSNE